MPLLGLELQSISRGCYIEAQLSQVTENWQGLYEGSPQSSQDILVLLMVFQDSAPRLSFPEWNGCLGGSSELGAGGPNGLAESGLGWKESRRLSCERLQLAFNKLFWQQSGTEWTIIKPTDYSELNCVSSGMPKWKDNTVPTKGSVVLPVLKTV